jgi:hypothetical protein
MVRKTTNAQYMRSAAEDEVTFLLKKAGSDGGFCRYRPPASRCKAIAAVRSAVVND